MKSKANPPPTAAPLQKLYEVGISKVLIDAATLQQRIQQLGQQITADYRHLVTDTPLCLVAVLKGSFVFFADLIRSIELPVICEFIGISSYGAQTTSTGIVRITADLHASVRDMHVVLIEDIVDTGLTICYLYKLMQTRGIKSVKVCTLLHKPTKSPSTTPLDYVGFVIPDTFVVGYGLDFQEKFRNLSYIGEYAG